MNVPCLPANWTRRASLSFPTHSKTLVAKTQTFSDTFAAPALMSGVAGRLTCFWGRSEAVTEAEWLGCTDPKLMLEFLRRKASERKLRLFSVACCRRIWYLVTDERSREAVLTAEQVDDGEVGSDKRVTAAAKAHAACVGASVRYLFSEPTIFAARAAYHAISQGNRSVLY